MEYIVLLPYSTSYI